MGRVWEHVEDPAFDGEQRGHRRQIPTGVRAWIEDVVVDEAARGQGAGQSLVVAAIEHAQKIGARTVDLTSRPSREAANRLYQRAGFQLRETNVYRVTLEKK